MKAVDILNDAAVLVDGKRAEQHGDMNVTFAKIASLWAGHISMKFGVNLDVTAEDVAWMMVDLKKVRALSGVLNEDDYTDSAGYIGIAAETRRL